MTEHLPVTDKWKPRPVYLRWLKRKHHMPLGSPTEIEKSDAIRVLKDAWLWSDEITDEAEKIFMEASE